VQKQAKRPGAGAAQLKIDEIRRHIVTALFSDDELMQQLVLKGGNALSMIHGIADRASVDLDFSLQSSFLDEGDAERRIGAALTDEFRALGYRVFDYAFHVRPSPTPVDMPEWWGGYEINFKLIGEKLAEAVGGDLAAMRRQSEVLGPNQKRTYSIDVSRHEYCSSKEKHEIDHLLVYVYSLEMIAIEKLRAICQQMREYEMTPHKRPRPRDFYDIVRVLDRKQIDLSTGDARALLQAIFAAKNVSLDLISLLSNYRDFHAADWESVRASVSQDPGPFDPIFDRVLAWANQGSN
jgi:predicted nucleotidyltransferase component of viral defense system